MPHRVLFLFFFFGCLPQASNWPKEAGSLPGTMASSTPSSQEGREQPAPTPKIEQITSTAPKGWHWDSPTPQGNTLNGFWASDAEHLYLVGDAGALLRSTDGGSSWEPWETSFTNLHDTDFTSVWGSDPDNIYITGKTNNGGILLHLAKGWSRSQGFHEELEKVWGTGANDVYVIGHQGLISHSSDNGDNWSAEKSGTIDAFYGMWGDAKNLIVVGGLDKTTILQKAQGKPWRKSKQNTTYVLTSVCGDGAGKLFSVGQQGVILRSTDGGSSWKKLQSGTEQNLLGVWCGAKNEVIAVGSQGTMLRTTDAGKSWTLLPTQDPGVNLYGIAGYQAPGGVPALFAMGDYGALLRSLDGGLTWRSLRSAAPDLADIWGSSEYDIYAVGWDGAVLHGDGRERWGRLQIGAEETELVSVWGSGPKDVYILGLHGDVFHSLDGGDSWQRWGVPADQTVSQIWGTDSNNVYIVGSSGLILHSSDQGKTWEKRESGTEHHLEAIWGDGPNNLYIVGDYGIILRSIDGGKSWQNHRLWTPKAGVGGKGLTSVVGNKAGEVFAVGYCNGCLAYSPDAGKTWEVRDLKIDEPMPRLGLQGEQVLALGYSGKILRLDKTRSKWEVLQTPSQLNLFGMWVTKEGLYAVSTGGTVVHNASLED